MDLTRLRRAFDDRLVEEVHQYGGIPNLSAKELELREAVAELLHAASPDPAPVPVHESGRPCGCDPGAHWTCEQHRQHALADATGEP